MGNAMDVRLREDREEFKLTEDLFQQFRDHINRVDYTVTGFVKSVDSMRASCEMLLRQIDINNHPAQDSDISNSSVEVSNMQLSRELLETIHSGVSDHKYVLMESVSKMLHFVWEMGKNLTILSGDRPLEFSVDKYLTLCLAANTNDWDMQNDARTAELEEELTKLPSPYEIAKKEISILNEREVTYRKEIENLEEEVEEMTKRLESFTGKQTMPNKMSAYEQFEELHSFDGESLKKKFDKSDAEHNVDELKKENMNLRQNLEDFKNDMTTARRVNEEALERKDQEIEKLKQDLQAVTIGHTTEERLKIGNESLSESLQKDDEENAKLTEEINTLKTEVDFLKKKKVLHVLEYDVAILDSSSQMTTFKGNLFQLLEREMILFNVELKIGSYRPYKATMYNTEQVIVAYIDIRFVREIGNKICKANKEFTGGPNIAVLLFYDAELHLVCEEVENFTEGLERFGGVFKFGYSYRPKQHQTEKNKINIKNLIQFLKTKVLYS